MDGWNGVGYEVGNFLNFDLFALAFRFLVLVLLSLEWTELEKNVVSWWEL